MPIHVAAQGISTRTLAQTNDWTLTVYCTGGGIGCEQPHCPVPGEGIGCHFRYQMPFSPPASPQTCPDGSQPDSNGNCTTPPAPPTQRCGPGTDNSTCSPPAPPTKGCGPGTDNSTCSMANP
jgi:hypothetical protein